MRKKIFAIVLAFITLLSMTACTEKGKGLTESQMFKEDQARLARIGTSFWTVESTKPSEKQKETCEEVFCELCKRFGFTKSMPLIRVVTPENMKKAIIGNMPCFEEAFYVGGTIYLLPDYNDKAAIAHLMIHYFSGDGYSHLINMDCYTGRYLTEGVTEYFSTQCFKHSKEMPIVYDLLVHIAKVLAITYGEENLANDFFFNTSEETLTLKYDFNNLLNEVYQDKVSEKYKTLSIFDIFVTAIDALTYNIEDSRAKNNSAWEKNLNRANEVANSLEEMLLIYATKKGVYKEVVREIKSFSRKSYLFNGERGLSYSELWKLIG